MVRIPPRSITPANSMSSYTTALSCPTTAEESKTIKLNRALACLKNEYFDAALEDTNCLKAPSDASEKALYRAGQALYQLGRFSDCHEILKLLSSRYPDNRNARVDLRRVSCRMEEQSRGTYDFEAIHEQVSRLRPPHLDHATYTGPIIIKPSDGRGRGWFTTEAVKAGDLLLCEKVFAHCFADPTDKDRTNQSAISLLVNLGTKRMTMGTQVDLITKIAQKLWRNPSLISEFTSLHHGSYVPVDVGEADGKPIVDT
jgi:hypothetical protein